MKRRPGRSYFFISFSLSLSFSFPDVLDWLQWTKLVQRGQHSQYHQSINVFGEWELHRRRCYSSRSRSKRRRTESRQLGQPSGVHPRLHRLCGRPWQCLAISALGLPEWRRWVELRSEGEGFVGDWMSIVGSIKRLRSLIIFQRIHLDGSQCQSFGRPFRFCNRDSQPVRNN